MGNLTQNDARPVGHLTFVTKRLSAVGNKRISQFFDSAREPRSRVIDLDLVDSTIKKFIVAENFTELASKGKRFCFISFIENTKIGQDTILVAMDVSSLYTNIPQEEGIKIVCKAYETFHNNDPPIPTHYLREMLGLILTENSFEFNKKNYLQTHGVAMGTKQQCLLLIYSWRR